MNICFVMAEGYEDLARRVHGPSPRSSGMVGIKGHRLVGGFRASCYNALPKESVEALVACMQEFAQQTREIGRCVRRIRSADCGETKRENTDIYFYVIDRIRYESIGCNREAFRQRRLSMEFAGSWRMPATNWRCSKNTPTRAELLAAVADADALIIRSDKVTAEVIAAAKNLKIVVRAGAGYDNVDLAAASARGIVVMNTPGQNSNAVAELALGHDDLHGAQPLHAGHGFGDSGQDARHPRLRQRRQAGGPQGQGVGHECRRIRSVHRRRRWSSRPTA